MSFFVFSNNMPIFFSYHLNFLHIFTGIANLFPLSKIMFDSAVVAWKKNTMLRFFALICFALFSKSLTKSRYKRSFELLKYVVNTKALEPRDCAAFGAYSPELWKASNADSTKQYANFSKNWLILGR